MSPDPGRDPNATLRRTSSSSSTSPSMALAEHARPAKHVWHLSVRAAPDDPILTDEEWADIARRIVAATGIAPGDGQPGCRWAAVRHADDHIHIIATLVRDDGRRPDDYRSGKRAQAEARLIEKPTTASAASPPATAPPPSAPPAPNATRPNARAGSAPRARNCARPSAARWPVPPARRSSSTGSPPPASSIRKRVAPSGDLLGYKVALPDDRNKDGEPVFYPGSTPRPRPVPAPHPRTLVRRLRPHRTTADRRSGRTAPDRDLGARRRTAHRHRRGLAALLVIDHGERRRRSRRPDRRDRRGPRRPRQDLRRPHPPRTARGRLGVRAGLPLPHPSRVRGHDAGPAPGRPRPRPQRARARPRRGRRHHRDGPSTCCSSSSPPPPTGTPREDHAQQAEAARQAAEHLRAAYQAAAAQPLGVLHQRGPTPEPAAAPARRPSSAPGPARAGRDRSSPSPAGTPWPPPSPTPKRRPRPGRPAGRGRRSAGNWTPPTPISDVLVWRLRRMADLPADASPPARDQHRR